jgi:nicotinate-nucleotide adenylyltransferase
VKKIAILGGTFDPVHIGHLRSAVELREQLGCDELRLIPARIPPHRRQPVVSAEHRLRMLQLGVADEPGLLVDDRELQRDGPSYTYDTLRELRTEFGADCSLALVMGADACAALDSWHRWHELFDLAHLVIMARPDVRLPATGVVADALRPRLADAGALGRSPAGTVVRVALTPLPVSATAIRALVAAGRSPRYLLPDAVWRYIVDHRLYTPSAIAAAVAAATPSAAHTAAATTEVNRPHDPR